MEYKGVNMEYIGVNMEHNGVNMEYNGVNMEYSGVNMVHKSVSMEHNGVIMVRSGVSLYINMLYRVFVQQQQQPQPCGIMLNCFVHFYTSVLAILLCSLWADKTYCEARRPPHIEYCSAFPMMDNVFRLDETSKLSNRIDKPRAMLLFTAHGCVCAVAGEDYNNMTFR